MIGTNEDGLRILFCQCIMKYKHGLIFKNDYRPTEWDSSNQPKFIYGELRSFGQDYIFEIYYKLDYNVSHTRQSMEVMNGRFESEAKLVKNVIHQLDEFVSLDPDLSETIK